MTFGPAPGRAQAAKVAGYNEPPLWRQAYDGRNFARDGVVCVVINWRLGADGFLDLGDNQANVGLLDQVNALEWTHENIAAFGGDPENVTVFGQSVGALNIGVLLSVPSADGLFRRAILEGGAAHHAIPTETAQKIGRLFAEKLGVQPSRSALAAVPTPRLLAAQAELKADLAAHPDPGFWGHDVVASTMLWQPSIDGDVVPGRPIDRIAGGAGAGVDVIARTNAEDWKMFLAITGSITKVKRRPQAGPARICTSLAGRRQVSVPSTLSRSPSSSTPWTRTPDCSGPSWERNLWKGIR